MDAGSSFEGCPVVFVVLFRGFDQTGIKAALDFLADFFGIAEILKTAELMQASVVSGLDVILGAIPTDKDVRGVFDKLRLTLENAT